MGIIFAQWAVDQATTDVNLSDENGIGVEMGSSTIARGAALFLHRMRLAGSRSIHPQHTLFFTA